MNKIPYSVRLYYSPIAPSFEAAAIDREVAAGLTCKNCLHEGLTYKPYTRPLTGEYRAFAVCPKCDEVEEF